VAVKPVGNVNVVTGAITRCEYVRLGNTGLVGTKSRANLSQKNLTNSMEGSPK
jgi:hypothetical protein